MTANSRISNPLTEILQTTIKSFKAGWDIEYLDITFSTIETLDLSNVFYLRTIRLMQNENLTGKVDLTKVKGMDFTINFIISGNTELRSILLPGDVFIFHTSHMKNGKTSYSNGGQVFVIE